MVNNLYYIIVALFFCVSHVLNATERTDFRVNDDRSTTLQKSPRIAVAVDNTFVITWIDSREGTSDIYIQKYNSSGFPVGNNLKINDDSNESYQLEPAISVELSGTYSMVWKDHRTGSFPFNPEIFTQRFDSTFTPVDTNQQLTIETPLTTRETPDISLSDSKQSVIVWADYRNSNWDIYGQLVAPDGSNIGNNFLVNDDNINAQQHRPRVSVSNLGWFVVTWYDNRFGDDDIFVQVFDSLGTPLNSNVLVSQGTENARQAFPDVTTDGAGNFTVVWVDWRNGVYPSNPDIYSRKFTSSMTPVGDEVNINTDNASTAQREPAISADRLGNVAIIWADSIGNSWDISGQMIDVDGVVRDTNFTANTDSDSAQVSPDVAIDGKQRYVTWVDRRNGNFDIYASIQEYNDPNLSVSNSFIQFTMQEGDPVPSAQSLIVEHLGYNPIGFTVISNMTWLDVTPSTSTTTDTISLVVNTDTLSNGTYTGILTFADHLFNDSSVSVAVKLIVYTPTMKLSLDTLSFSMFESVSENASQKFSINNISFGSFSWTASESISWLTVSSYAGFSSDSISIDIDPIGMTAGLYTGDVVFTSADAIGSPDTLVVNLEIVNNLPYIIATPDSIFLYTDSIENLTKTITVSNFGTDSLLWTATANGGWFTLDTSSGTDNEDITLAIDSLEYGRHVGSIVISDANSFNKSVQVPIILDYYQKSQDSLKFSTANTATIQTVSISLTLDAINNLNEIHLPFQFETTYVQLDSIIKGVTTPEITTLTYDVNNVNGTALLHIIMSQVDTSFNIGSSHLAELYFTAKSVLGVSSIDSIITDSATVYVLDTAGEKFAPSVIAGTIDVDVATGIYDDIPIELPGKIELSQNYPNPFNLSTIISYSLPTRSQVNLNIYNILGQNIRVLLNEIQPAGVYQVAWNGRYNDGRVAPSGIYFYRFEALSDVLVKKMILLK